MPRVSTLSLHHRRATTHSIYGLADRLAAICLPA